jgi:predicted enzyme related to lactoylglutathione lyase
VGSRFTELVIDAADPAALAAFWGEVLGWEVTEAGDEGAELRAPGGARPALVFVPVPEAKAVKNRVHLDVNPVGCDQETELARLTALGARPVDIGQGDQPWVVLADPEGNEFCLLRTTVDAE